MMTSNEQAMGSVDFDPDDAPELTEEFFERADEYIGERLVSECITIRLSPEVLKPFRASGPGWQTRMNAALADWLKSHAPTDVSV